MVSVEGIPQAPEAHAEMLTGLILYGFCAGS